MRRFFWVIGTIFLATACIGIVDNSGMGDEHGTGGAGGGTNATVGTTTSTSSTSTTSTGNAGSGSFTTGSPTGSGGSGFGSSSTGTGSIGSGGDPSGGTGGGFGGSSGGLPDAGGGRGGSGGGIAQPDAGHDTGIVNGATFTQVKAIVQQRCGNCHNFANYNTLMTHSVGNCGGDKLAKASDTANSAFLELVQGQGCGGFLMPRGCSNAPCISAADIQTFTSWINAGALNN